MLLDKNVEINISNRVKSYYKKLGYNVDKNKITVKIHDLPKNSHVYVNVMCDKCGKTKKIMWNKYIINTKNEEIYYSCSQKCSVEKVENIFIEKYGFNSSAKSEIVKEKQKKTNIERYGFVCPLKNKDIKEKRRITMINRYGVEYTTQNKDLLEKIMSKIIDTVNKRRNTMIKNGNIIVDNSELIEYNKEVRKLTRKNKNKLLELWDGYDYYDGEYIKNNFIKYKNNNKNYPNIDHKISINYGYINKISAEEMSSIDNLCLTKRYINIKKRNLCESDFIF